MKFAMLNMKYLQADGAAYIWAVVTIFGQVNNTPTDR